LTASSMLLSLPASSMLLSASSGTFPLPIPHQHLSGPGPPDFRGFTITLRHSTIGGTPLDEWSARRRRLYLTKHRASFVEVTMTELLNYLHSNNAASVQVTMTELATQFQCQIPVFKSRDESVWLSNLQVNAITRNRIHLACVKTHQTL
jgi:hypothetical protein